MIPQGFIDFDLIAAKTAGTTRTYKLSGNRIQGFADGLEALQQAIYKVLNTEKYEYPIYSFSYGIELENLIGKDPLYVQVELKRRIRECLFKDERIQGVDNFKFETSGDHLLCVFDVISTYGKITVTKGVEI